MTRTVPSAAVLALLLASGCAIGPVAQPPARVPLLLTAVSKVTTPNPSSGLRRRVLGRSVRGRVLVAWSLGPASAPRRLLVVGCIHGDEAAGIALSLALLRTSPPAGTEVTVVPDMNPDGLQAGTRQNAHGVDLSRNFPYLWQPLGHRGDQQYAGTGPLSEPEVSRMAAFVARLHPTVSVWFHQPVDVVDLSGGSVALERRFAQSAGMQLRRLTRYPGSATGWQNAEQQGTTAFVVELPRPLGADRSAQVLRALQDLER